MSNNKVVVEVGLTKMVELTADQRKYNQLVTDLRSLVIGKPSKGSYVIDSSKLVGILDSVLC